MYNWKDLVRGALAFTIMMTFLAGIMTLHALSIAGLL
jgi:hypothetical protein